MVTIPFAWKAKSRPAAPGLDSRDPEDTDIAFGLCDLGMGAPELGLARLSDLAALRGATNLPVDRDLHLVATKPLSAYASEARAAGGIQA